MTQYLSDVTAVSTKGQVVLPKAILQKLQLTAGAKRMVFSDGVSILLQPIPEPDISEFQNLMDSAASWATEFGITEDDITAAIKTVRSRRKATT